MITKIHHSTVVLSNLAVQCPLRKVTMLMVEIKVESGNYFPSLQV